MARSRPKTPLSSYTRYGGKVQNPYKDWAKVPPKASRTYEIFLRADDFARLATGDLPVIIRHRTHEFRPGDRLNIWEVRKNLSSPQVRGVGTMRDPHNDKHIIRNPPKPEFTGRKLENIPIYGVLTGGFVGLHRDFVALIVNYGDPYTPIRFRLPKRPNPRRRWGRYLDYDPRSGEPPKIKEKLMAPGRSQERVVATRKLEAIQKEREDLQARVSNLPKFVDFGYHVKGQRQTSARRTRNALSYYTTRAGRFGIIDLAFYKSLKTIKHQYRDKAKVDKMLRKLAERRKTNEITPE